MRTFSSVCFFLIFAAQYCNAQVSVNPNWIERNGLTVASSQTVSVPARILRGFLTLESVDVDPRNAIANLRVKKKLAIDAVRTIDVLPDSIKTTSTRILEWEKKPKYWTLNPFGSNGLSPAVDTDKFTAVVHLSFDIPVTDMDSDELTIMPYDVCKRLQKQSVFESTKIVLLYIGEVKETQIRDANKKAYDEALADAKSIASLSGRPLGKLASLTPEVNGRWRYWSDLEYGYWNDEEAGMNAMTNFSPSENEVFGTDASKLSRTFSVELRFSIEEVAKSDTPR